MRKFLPTSFFIAACALGVGVAAGSLATASYAPKTSDDEIIHRDDNAVFPMPVIGEALFALESSQPGCMSRDRVIDAFLADQSEIGGQTVQIAEPQDQAFADHWRARAGTASVEVSAIVGHIFQDYGSSEWTVDLVEFDADGCAMSRTLLSANLWNALIEGSQQA